MSNNPKYRQLRAFCLAVEHGSFNAAAAALHVSAPSFTLLIRNLEEDLGIRLFDRTTRRCELTESGLNFYRRVSRPLQDMEEAYRYAKEEGEGALGRLAIATVPSLACGVLAEIAGLFHQQHPGVRLFLSEHRSNEVIAAVQQNQAELGIARLVPAQDDLQTELLFRDRLLVAAPHGHPILAQRRTAWRDLGRHKLILIGGGLTELQVRRALPGASYSIEVTHMATAVSMIRQGLGIGVVPTSALDGLNVAGIGFSAIRQASAIRQLGAIYRSHRPLSTAARRFLALTSEHASRAMERWEGQHLARPPALR